MPLSYSSPGAAFGDSFETYLMQRQQEEHRQMLDDLAQKREQRLAQAELDSASERQDEMARKRAKDAEDAHQKKVANFEKRTSNMVKGDRPDPEMVNEAKTLGLQGVFRTSAPAMSTAPAQPPAALMEAPPAGAPVEGTEVPTPEGAMAPGPMVYPGSPKERQKEAEDAKAQAFVDALPEDDPRKAELKMALGADAAGLKVPAGYFTKGGAAGDSAAVMRQNTRKGTVERLIDGQWSTWTGDVPKGAHWMTEAQPKDTTASDLARDNALQRNISAGNKRLYDELGKAELSKITAASDIQDALAQNTEVADATLAPLVLKSTITAGGNSGFRMTKPEIDRVLTRSVWDDLKLRLNSFSGGGPLQLTPAQKAAMRKLAAAIYDKASANYAKLNDAEDKINNAQSAHEINQIVTDTKRLFAPAPMKEEAAAPAAATAGGPPPVIGRIKHDASGMMIPTGAQ